MKTIIVILLSLAGVQARCRCECVDGEHVPICERSWEVAPTCGYRVCPIAPPRVKPLDPVRVPPVGTDYCTYKLVWDRNENKYVWKEVCR